MKLTATREDLLAPPKRDRRGRAAADDAGARRTCCCRHVTVGWRSRGRISRSSSCAATKVGLAEQPGDHRTGRKLLDIFRALPEGVSITLSTEGSASACAPAAAVSLSRACPRPNFRSSRRSTRRRRSPCPRGNSRAHRQDAFLDGAAGRALLPQRPSAGAERQAVRAVATDGHRLALCEMALPSPGRAGRSSCRARAYWSCSGSSAPKATWSWRLGLITFASRSATFASLRS